MPLFFFHLHDDVDVPDLEGQEFADLTAATAFATDQARELAGQLIKEQGRVVLSHRIDIEDEKGAVLATVRLRDVVTVES